MDKVLGLISPTILFHVPADWCSQPSRDNIWVHMIMFASLNEKVMSLPEGGGGISPFHEVFTGTDGLDNFCLFCFWEMLLRRTRFSHVQRPGKIWII